MEISYTVTQEGLVTTNEIGDYLDRRENEMDGKKKRNFFLNKNKIRVNKELFDEYTWKKDRADADERKSLLSEYTKYFVFLNQFQIDKIFFNSPVTVQTDFSINANTTWNEIKTGLVIRKKSKNPAIRYSVREDLYTAFLEKEVSRFISNYEKKYNSQDGTEIPFLAGMCTCLSRAKSRFWNLVQYYEVVKSCDWVTDNILEDEERYVKGTKKKLTTVIDAVAEFKAKHDNPSTEEICDYFRAKKRYTDSQIDDLVGIVLSRPAFVLDKPDRLPGSTNNGCYYEESRPTDFENEEILYDVITRLLDDLSEKSEENYYILSHYCDDKETIDFGKTKIYYYKYFENHFGLDALKTLEEIAKDLGGEWTAKGVEFRYQVVIEEDLNCNIMIKKK